MLNDLLTLTKIREGDIKAFEDVFRRYYSPLCWYAMSITGSMEAAEEIVEELFYGVWRDRERLPLFRSMKSYLYVAVRNQSFQYCEHLEVRNKYREFVLSRKGRTQDSSPQEDRIPGIKTFDRYYACSDAGTKVAHIPDASYGR